MSAICGIPCLVMVSTSQRGVVTKMGQFSHIADPGLHCICYPFQTINSVSIQVRQEDVKVEAKTRDNVTVNITIALQFAVNPAKVEDYYFKLSNPLQQMAASVDGILRFRIPRMELNEVFSAKTDIAREIMKDLSEKFPSFGVDMHSCLVTDINPDSNVSKP